MTAWGLTFLWLAYRVQFGAEDGDESFYSTLPYGFLLGNKPYLDELAMHQNGGIALIPLYRAYLWIKGSAEGVILFNRGAFLLYTALVSLLTFRLTSKLCGRASAAWGAALVATHAYYNLFALSYNTLGMLGLTSGLLLLALGLLDERPGRKLFMASVFGTLAVFAYPTLALVWLVEVALAGAWLLRLHPAARRSGFLGLLGGLALSALAACAFIAWVTPDGLRRAVEYEWGMGYAGFGNAAATDLKPLPRLLLIGNVALLALFPLAWARLPRLTPGLVALVPLGLCLLYRSAWRAPMPSAAAMFQAALPALLIVCALLMRGRLHNRLLLQFFCVPALVAEATVAKTSANGAVSACLGALPALAACAAALTLLGQSLASRRRDQFNEEPALIGSNAALIGAFCAAGLAIQVHSTSRWVYDEYIPNARESESVWSYHDRVRVGPFRGTLTHAPQVEKLEALHRDVKQVEAPGKTLLTIGEVGAAYLSTSMRPRTFSHWVMLRMLRPDFARELFLRSFGAADAKPDFVVVDHAIMREAKRYFLFPFRRSYKALIARPEYGYTIYRRVGRG
ncbi:MAG: hypothetical protein QM756_24645 [Polyangiaceae bacterium]